MTCFDKEASLWSFVLQWQPTWNKLQSRMPKIYYDKSGVDNYITEIQISKMRNYTRDQESYMPPKASLLVLKTLKYNPRVHRHNIS